MRRFTGIRHQISTGALPVVAFLGTSPVERTAAFPQTLPAGLSINFRADLLARIGQTQRSSNMRTSSHAAAVDVEQAEIDDTMQAAATVGVAAAHLSFALVIGCRWAAACCGVRLQALVLTLVRQSSSFPRAWLRCAEIASVLLPRQWGDQMAGGRTEILTRLRFL